MYMLYTLIGEGTNVQYFLNLGVNYLGGGGRFTAMVRQFHGGMQARVQSTLNHFR